MAIVHRAAAEVGQGGRPGQQGGQPAQQGGRPQGGRPQGGRPQGGRPQGGRPQHAGAPQQGGAPQGEGGPGGKPREDRRGYGGPPQRRPRPQGSSRSRSAQDRPHEFKGKPKPLIPITDAMKKGKEPMRTFGDLMQFFGAKTDDQKPPAKDKKEHDERECDKREHDEQEQGQQQEQGKKSVPIANDAPAAEAVADSAAPRDANFLDANLGSAPPAPPLSPEPAESVSPAAGGPSPEPQTPPADEGQE